MVSCHAKNYVFGGYNRITFVLVTEQSLEYYENSK
jgi:hypothetical protein